MNLFNIKLPSDRAIYYRDNIEGNSFFLILATLTVYCYFCLGLVLPFAHGIPAILLIILGVWSLIRHTPTSNPYPSKWLLAMYLLPVITAIPHLMMDNDFEVLDTPSRYLLAIPLLWLIPFIRINAQFLLFSAACGLWVGGIGALLGYFNFIDYYSPPPRLALINGVHVIFYAYLQAALFIITFAYLLLLRPTKRWFIIFILGGLGLGFFALFSSGTRGAWLSLIIILPTLVFMQYKPKKQSLWRLLFPPLTILLLIIGSSQIPHVKKTYSEDINEIKSYIASNQLGNFAKSSFGERVIRWHEALLLFSERPLLGWGYQDRFERHQQYIKEGKSHHYKVDGLKSSTHNEILHMAAQRGILGLIALFPLYIIPVWIAWKKEKVVRIPIICLAATYFISGLTESPLLYHQATALFYAFTIPLLLSAKTVPIKQSATPV